jgi:hypothetical protein
LPRVEIEAFSHSHGWQFKSIAFPSAQKVSSVKPLYVVIFKSTFI